LDGKPRHGLFSILEGEIPLLRGSPFPGPTRVPEMTALDLALDVVDSLPLHHPVTLGMVMGGPALVYPPEATEVAHQLKLKQSTLVQMDLLREAKVAEYIRVQHTGHSRSRCVWDSQSTCPPSKVVREYQNQLLPRVLGHGDD